MNHICNTCGKVFISHQSLGGHVIRAHSKTLRKTLSEIKTLERRIVIKQCKRCGNGFEVIRTVSKHGEENVPKKERSFCSRSCANTRKHSIQTKKKISISRSAEVIKKSCKNCEQIFETKNKKQKFCSVKCANDSKRLHHYTDKKTYSHRCRFTFDPYDYPELFNIELLEEYGWYRPWNSKKGPNYNGVSRDHLYSVSEGYKNNISPEIMSHPANCRLVLHYKENVSKNDHCIVTLEQLKERINNWEL